MADTLPDNTNRLAYWVGIVLHPYIIYLIPAVITLGLDGLRWSLLVVLTVVIPIGVLVLVQRRRARYVYQRQSRTPLYIVGWLGVLACWAIAQMSGAPIVFIAGVASIALWAPLQFLVNTFITKASVHTALVAMSVIGLVMTGHLNTPVLLLAGLAVIVAASWARMVTRNHTLAQVVIGALLGALAVMLVFSWLAP